MLVEVDNIVIASTDELLDEPGFALPCPVVVAMRNEGQFDTLFRHCRDPMRPCLLCAERCSKFYEGIEDRHVMAVARQVFDQPAGRAADTAVLYGTQDLGGDHTDPQRPP